MNRVLLTIAVIVTSLSIVQSTETVAQEHQRQKASRGIGYQIDHSLPKPVHPDKKEEKKKQVYFTFEKMKVGSIARNWTEVGDTKSWKIGNALSSPSGVAYFGFESEGKPGRCFLKADHFQVKFPDVQAEIILNQPNSTGGILWTGRRQGETFSAIIERENGQIKVNRTFQNKTIIIGSVKIPKLKTSWHTLAVKIRKGHTTVIHNHKPIATFFQTNNIDDVKVGLTAKNSAHFDNFRVKF